MSFVEINPIETCCELNAQRDKFTLGRIPYVDVTVSPFLLDLLGC